ncbi:MULTISPECIES: RsiV family protein [Niastella]|uniref:DUF3298 domain-containing protein n=1 Tax=Niastella soli TaxID=2821487 RepID=A0ABS3YNI4_9BACT|nr:RsiV family protein [Niastella soli]MBO9199443.1 DUF3298 domain-containing protein [Niastella soli]
MRHIYILLFILGTVTTTYAQTSKPAPVITRYYCFTGTIDKYPVTFYLFRNNNQFSGSYYYNSTEESIAVSGQMDKSGFLTLSHSDNEGNNTETLSGNFKDSSFSGTWSYKGKLLSFRVALRKDNNGLAFDYIYTHGEKKLAKEEFGRTELAYSASTIWPAASATHPATSLIKEAIFDAFGVKPGSEEIGKVLIRLKNAQLNPVRKEDEGINYDQSQTVQIEYLSDKLLTISDFGYFDGGGAHGMYATIYTCIDLVHNRKLTINDVLDSAACHNQLQTLLEKKFRTVYKVKKEEKLSEYLLEDTISLTKNISLTSKGIRFNYNPYQIGSYAMGEIQLYLPFKELDACLKPEFKKLLGL